MDADGVTRLLGRVNTARAMPQVLIAHARQHAAQKRAGDRVRVTFEDIDVQAGAAR
jgi:hypothetical protein